jgi:hypothetical protein
MRWRRAVVGLAIVVWVILAANLAATLGAEVVSGCGFPPNGKSIDSTPPRPRETWQWWPSPGWVCEYRGVVYEKPSTRRGVETAVLLASGVGLGCATVVGLRDSKRCDKAEFADETRSWDLEPHEAGWRS